MKTSHPSKPAHHANRITDDHQPSFVHDLTGLKDSITQLRTDVAGLMQTAAHAGQTGAAAVQDQAGQALQGLSQTVAAGLTGLKKTSGRSAKAVTRQIQQRPVTSALVAVGMGYVLARYFSRR
jgi:ElaB/YqjD/DUF883 family membrane-anchored ribosome-binding protein